MTSSSAAARVPAPGMLLVGSASRDAGKTELACRLLRRFRETAPVVGVKVTVVDPEGEGCPRGEESCGVCRSFEGPLLLQEERDPPPDKDTGRMRAAGASRVLWLRVRRDALAAGFAALWEAIGPGVPAVTESNSLRAAVDPDLFLMLSRAGAERTKDTAAAVRGYADRLVRFDGTGFDLDLAALEIAAGRWRLREPATAIVLAGGRSRRMGTDKLALEIDGVRLLERVVASLRPHVREVLIGASAERPVAIAGARTVPDRQPGQGPLMGLASCLAASTSDRNLVAACDLPEIPEALVARLLDEALTCEVAVPRGPDGGLEPLLAVYRRRLLPDIELLLAAGERRIRPLFEGRRVCYVPLAELGLAGLPNLNTPEDVVAFESSRRRPR